MIRQILLSVETTLLLSVAALYIVHCPFNKVEESFNTQAVHDIINLFPDHLPYKDISKDGLIETGRNEISVRSQLPWDHIQFPGVVPRTFVGALIVGMPMKLAKYLMSSSFLSDDTGAESEPDLTSQFLLQIGARFALSSFLVLSLSAITRAIQKRYGLSFRLCFLIATISQFHYMFYAGRFIPNTFAAILANLVFASWINRQYSKSIIYIAICVVIFRFDTSIFFGWLLFDAVFIRRYITLAQVLRIGIPAGLLALLISFAIDSLFWTKPVWPEFEGLYFNLWLNKSHEWGTQPYSWYIYSCLPRILMASSPMVLLADHKITRDYLIPTLAFIFTYSLLPHKELRFILFVAPFLNMSVASGMINVHFYLHRFFQIFNLLITKSKSTAERQKKLDEKPPRSYLATFLFTIVLVGMFTANIFGCFVLSRISSHNYPGGHAAISLGTTKELLDRAQKSLVGEKDGLRDPRSDVGVYVNNLAAQTGVSRFIQVDGVYYSKTPKLDENTFNKSYNLIYLILEPKEVTSYLKSYCPLDDNQEIMLSQGLSKWKKSNTEIKCNLPSQAQMYCSILDTIKSFKSVNIGGLYRRLRQILSTQVPVELIDDSKFIRTKIALHILRCSTRSKFNPFS